VRSIKAQPAISPSPPPIPALVPFFLLAIPVFLWSQRAHSSDPWAEDLPVYTQAIHAWLAGHNPYNASLAPLYFLYPPPFLFLAGWISHLVPQGWGATLYVIFTVLALIAIPLILARFFFRQPWLSPLFALLLFFASPRFTGIQALRTMNVASLIYCAAFLAAIPGLKRGRWEWFYLAVFMAAIIKITFLPLLLIPLLAGKRQWMGSILCGSAVVATNLAEMFFLPELYRGYLWSLQQGILGRQAFGYGIFGVMAHHKYWERGGTGVASYIVAAAVALLVVALMFYLRQRLARAQDLAANGAWLGLTVIAVILVNPRQMQYDMDVAVFAAFVLLVFAFRVRRVTALLGLMVLLFLPSLIIPVLVSNPRLHGVYETFLTFAAFALGYWRLTRETRLQAPAAPIVPA
jgi:hypothetical protein